LGNPVLANIVPRLKELVEVCRLEIEAAEDRLVATTDNEEPSGPRGLMTTAIAVDDDFRHVIEKAALQHKTVVAKPGKPGRDWLAVADAQIKLFAEDLKRKFSSNKPAEIVAIHLRDVCPEHIGNEPQGSLHAIPGGILICDKLSELGKLSDSGRSGGVCLDW